MTTAEPSRLYRVLQQQEITSQLRYWFNEWNTSGKYALSMETLDYSIKDCIYLRLRNKKEDREWLKAISSLAEGTSFLKGHMTQKKDTDKMKTENFETWVATFLPRLTARSRSEERVLTEDFRMIIPLGTDPELARRLVADSVRDAHPRGVVIMKIAKEGEPYTEQDCTQTNTRLNSVAFRPANPVAGYESLEAVLNLAYEQASSGKGAERHANSLPFDKQPMQALSGLLGDNHGLLFQAMKKIQEGSRFEDNDRAVREYLGAINYIAGAVIYLQGQTKGWEPQNEDQA